MDNFLFVTNFFKQKIFKKILSCGIENIYGKRLPKIAVEKFDKWKYVQMRVFYRENMKRDSSGYVGTLRDTSGFETNLIRYDCPFKSDI